MVIENFSNGETGRGSGTAGGAFDPLAEYRMERPVQKQPEVQMASFFDSATSLHVIIQANKHDEPKKGDAKKTDSAPAAGGEPKKPATVTKAGPDVRIPYALPKTDAPAKTGKQSQLSEPSHLGFVREANAAPNNATLNLLAMEIYRKL